MATVQELISRFFPNGTNEGLGGEQEPFPFWPPDLFAIAATILDSTGCFAWHRYRSGSYFTVDHMLDIVACGDWLRDFHTSDHEVQAGKHRPLFRFVEARWKTLLKANIPLDKLRSAEPRTGKLTRLTDAATDLLMIADHASRGAGFVPQSKKSGVAQTILAQYKQFVERLGGKRKTRLELLPHIPYSLCQMVPLSEACVLPKSRTPQVGCTLRSLSHNLALMPSGGGVRAQWTFGNRNEEFRDSLQEPLNLLVVPFPYRIPGRAFRRGAPCFSHKKSNWHFFSMEQTWLRNGRGGVSPDRFTRFLTDLIDAAERHVDKVHGVIMPELALEMGLAQKIAQRLAFKSNLDVLIAGVLDSGRDGKLPRNGAFGAFFVAGQPRRVLPWTQYKRHRWMLERTQIEGYHVGDRLHPNAKWWEGIDTSNQDCSFWVFRPGASLVTLICEDLARLDAVQSVIRSVGPNLVIALLMDGTQKEGRWSDRYAAVLADDPGSAVLTVTSLGLIKRYALRDQERESRIVALWKGAEKRATPIKLEKGHHAVLLTLFADSEENYALDGRSDKSGTVALYLSETHQIRLQEPEAWLQPE